MRYCEIKGVKLEVTEMLPSPPFSVVSFFTSSKISPQDFVVLANDYDTRISWSDQKGMYNVSAFSGVVNWIMDLGRDRSCECGSLAVGSAYHSSWCPLFERTV